MELRQLRYFKEVVTQGSFSGAANMLGRTQQTVSKSIAQLEENIGVPLLERGIRTVKPTTVGRLLLQHTKTIELQIDSFAEQLESIKRSNSGRVRIGAGPTATKSILPMALSLLDKAHSPIALEVYAGIVSDLLPQLLTGELDIFISLETNQINHPDVEKEILGYDKFCIVASSTHPLSSTNPTIHELTQYPWVMGRNLGELGPELDRFFLMENLSAPRKITYTTSLTFALETIRTLPYIGVLPKSIINESCIRGDLKLIDEQKFSWKRPIVLVYPQQVSLAPEVLSVIKALQEAAQISD